MKAENKKKLTNNIVIAALLFAVLYLWDYLEPRLIKLGGNAKDRWCAWRAKKSEACKSKQDTAFEKA